MWQSVTKSYFRLEAEKTLFNFFQYFVGNLTWEKVYYIQINELVKEFSMYMLKIISFGSF